MISQKVQDFYDTCIDDLIDYQQHFIEQRKQYVATELTVFLYSILAAVLIYTNKHIVLPIEHAYLSPLILFFGLAFYLTLFSVHFFVQRKWEIGVIHTIRSVKKVNPSNVCVSYSLDSGRMEITLMSTLFALFVFSCSILFLEFPFAFFISLFCALAGYYLAMRWIGYAPNNNSESKALPLLRDEELPATIRAWAIQTRLMKQMRFVNQSLELIRKTLLVSFIVYPAFIIGDIFSKDVSISLPTFGIYAFVSSIIFNIVILSIWNYDVVETQRDARDIFARGLYLEKENASLPQLWHRVSFVAPEKSVIAQMDNLYLCPLVLSQILGFGFIWSSAHDTTEKVIFTFVSAGMAVFLTFTNIRSSFSGARDRT